MVLNTSQTIAPAVYPFYDKNLLGRALPYLIHDLFAQRRPIPKNSSDQIKFRKYAAKAPALVQITEGRDPEGGTAAYSEVTFTLGQYGDLLAYTDKVELTNPDPVITELTTLNAEQAGETIDLVRRDSYIAGTQVRRAGGVATRAEIITALSVTDLEVVERAMLNNKCRYMRTMVNPQNGYATTPTNAAFFCITHSDNKKNIEGLTGFTPVAKYGTAAGATPYPSEIGQVGNFRFLITSQAKIWTDAGGTAVTNSLKYTTASTACDVYATLVFSENAVAVSDLEGEGLTTIIKSRSEAGSKLNLYGTVGWVAWLAQGILDDTRLYRIEHGVSALS